MLLESISDNALILPPSLLARVSACLPPGEEPSSLPLLLAQLDAASNPWALRYFQCDGHVIHLPPPASPRPVSGLAAALTAAEYAA